MQRGESSWNTKQLRLTIGSSSTSEVLPNRLGCISCWGESKVNTMEYHIFICDFDDGDVVCRIQIDGKCFTRAAFCIIGSTLYVFEGFSLKFPAEKNLNVFKRELEIMSDLKPNLKFDRSSFVKAGRLKDPKLAPAVIVLPTGRILVFSTTIEYKPVWKPKSDFEIFDPVKGVSYELPKLCPSSSLVCAVGRRDTFHVVSHAIMDPLVLLLKTDVGFFTLNLKPPYKNELWRYGDLCAPFPGGQNIPPHPSNSFVVIRKELCIIPYHAYDINQSGRVKVDPFSRSFYKFPDLSNIPDKGFVYGGLIVLEDDLNVRDDDVGLCFLKLGINDDRRIVMRFDMYHLDKEECWKELAANRAKKGMERELLPLPGVNKVKTFECIDEAAKFVSTFVFLKFSYIQRV